MIALTIMILRILVIIAIIRFVISLFVKKKPGQNGQKKERIKRFSDKDKKIDDGDFKEL